MGQARDLKGGDSVWGSVCRTNQQSAGISTGSVPALTTPPDEASPGDRFLSLDRFQTSSSFFF